MLPLIVSIVVLTNILAACNKSVSKDSDIGKSPSEEEKVVFKENISIINDTDTVYQFEEPGSKRFENSTIIIACLRDQTNVRIQEETKRTRKRLSESSDVFWSLSGLVNDNKPSFFVGGKATTSFNKVPDYIRSYFQEAGFNGEPDLVKLINAYKNGDRKAADLVERLVLYSAQQVNLIGEITLLAYSPRREKTIIGTHSGKWFIFDYRTFIETVPFANILFEDYLRTISDGLYSCCTDYDRMEIAYLEKQYNTILEKLKAEIDIDI